MNTILTVHYEDRPAYDIRIEPDFIQLPKAIEMLDMVNRRFFLITDSNVSRYYLDTVMEQLYPIAKTVVSHIIPAGEVSKNLDTANLCYEQLIQSGFDRNDVLIALGGGVVGDLTGFVAATYLRGVRFIQIPTSLLSMVDSSIGGKTGVDYKSYKNMVGAFHQPQLVYLNLSTLMSLPEREFYSGMGEIIKHGLIKDAAYYSWLKANNAGIRNKEYEILKEMIYRSCLIKKEVVEKDPKEQGDRALLNFGHTIGHSVEKLMNLTLLHGECVSVGIAAASYLSLKRGYLSTTEYKDILQTLKSFYQPVMINNLLAEDIYEVTKSDKKMDLNQIRFILLKEIGNAFIDNKVTKQEMLEAIQTILRG
jgi:3-dehydroquinate synthase